MQALNDFTPEQIQELASETCTNVFLLDSYANNGNQLDDAPAYTCWMCRNELTDYLTMKGT